MRPGSKVKAPVLALTCVSVEVCKSHCEEPAGSGRKSLRPSCTIIARSVFSVLCVPTGGSPRTELTLEPGGRLPSRVTPL